MLDSPEFGPYTYHVQLATPILILYDAILCDAMLC